MYDACIMLSCKDVFPSFVRNCVFIKIAMQECLEF